MLKDKKALEQYLDKQCDRIVTDNEKCKMIYTYANEKYEIPKGIVSDLVTKRMAMSAVSEFVLFILLDSICNVLKDNTDILGVDNFYSMQEWKHYRNSKYETEKIQFPLVFKMVQITDDQWVGKIDVDMLMKLRQAQLINYNVNAQRSLTKIVKGDKETYKITLNSKAVKSISDNYKDGTFIPNTITLNVPLDSDSDFYYDEEKSSLVINSLECFHISDGFHRYIAACQTRDANPEFNYSMELRVVNWEDSKAQSFIWQEDQRTPIRKVDSRSMNMNRAANIVVTRLNENVRCNLKGLINRNEGAIHFGELADLVDYFYFKGVGKEKERSVSIQAVKELTDNFNMLTEYNTEYLEHRMSYRTLLVAMFCFDYFKGNDNINVCEVIEKAVKVIEKSDSKKLNNRTPRVSLMSEVEKIVKGVL